MCYGTTGEATQYARNPFRDGSYDAERWQEGFDAGYVEGKRLAEIQGAKERHREHWDASTVEEKLEILYDLLTNEDNGD